MSARILLAEDHTLVRDGLRSLLERSGETVVGEADDGRKAVRLAKETDPDVVVMDVSMPGVNGIEATRQIVRDRPGCRVVVLSMHADRQHVVESLRAGACGYLPKDAAFAELTVAIRAVLSGRTYLSPAAAAVVVDNCVRGRPDSGGEPPGCLSAREREVLRHVAEGKSSVQIGRALHISAATVDTHRRNIMEKLDIHNVVDLVKFAVRTGLASLE
jgi:DNA-binding NarL/FixJ family response regulator